MSPSRVMEQVLTASLNVNLFGVSASSRIKVFSNTIRCLKGDARRPTAPKDFVHKRSNEQNLSVGENETCTYEM